MEKPTTLLELNILQIEEWNKSIKECALYMEYLEKKIEELEKENSESRRKFNFVVSKEQEDRIAISFDKEIELLNLDNTILNRLKDVRIQYVHELLDYSAKELKKFKGLGNRKVEVIEKALAEYSERSQLELFLISRGIELKLCGS